MEQSGASTISTSISSAYFVLASIGTLCIQALRRMVKFALNSVQSDNVIVRVGISMMMIMSTFKNRENEPMINLARNLENYET